MSEALGAPDSRPGTFLHARCGNCGSPVQVWVRHPRPKEIRFWWTMPLAAILWLAMMGKFGDFLSAPEPEMAPPAPIEASFVELPADRPNHPAGKTPKPPRPQPKRLPKKAAEPRPRPPHAATLPLLADSAASRPMAAATAPSPSPAPPADLMAYVKAAKERRRAAEMSAERENALASANERGPSEDEIRMANIKRNLQPQGTNGVFQVIDVGLRSGKYMFRGWTNNYSKARSELIEVDAGPDGDVEHAIVRSMIELIRRYFKGDFNWDSERLGRVIVLSARQEDNAGLEEFMRREFFGVEAGPGWPVPHRAR